MKALLRDIFFWGGGGVGGVVYLLYNITSKRYYQTTRH